MRGLLAIEPLYHRIISGHKTQTRRSGGLEEVNVFGIEGDNIFDFSPNDWTLCDSDINVFEFFNQKEQKWAQCKPRYHVGEVLYLKEPYKCVAAPVYIEYAFDHPNLTYESGYISDFRGKGYENKLFMPADFGREFIKVTGIKCERLLDISEADCIAEGIETAGNIVDGVYRPFGYIDYLMRPEAGSGYDFCDNDAKDSFISLYKLANKMGKFGSHYPEMPRGKREVANIWVWVYEFVYLPGYKK